MREAEGDLAGVALRTPPHPLLLTDMPPAAVDALASALAGDALPASPARWPSRPGSPGAYAGADAVPALSLRKFRLDAVHAPRTVAGRLREATGEDRDLLVEWSAAFGAEAMPHQEHAPARPIDLRLRQPGLL